MNINEKPTAELALQQILAEIEKFDSEDLKSDRARLEALNNLIGFCKGVSVAVGISARSDSGAAPKVTNPRTLFQNIRSAKTPQEARDIATRALELSLPESIQGLLERVSIGVSLPEMKQLADRAVAALDGKPDPGTKSNVDAVMAAIRGDRARSNEKLMDRARANYKRPNNLVEA